MKDIEGGGEIIVDREWFRAMCPKGTLIREPLVKGQMAFWAWPSLAITALMLLPFALMGATFVYWIATLPLMIYFVACQQYSRIIRGINRRPSSYLRVKAGCVVDGATPMCIEIDGGWQLYLRFPDATAADLYAIEYPQFVARAPMACWKL